MLLLAEKVPTTPTMTSVLEDVFYNELYRDFLYTTSTVNRTICISTSVQLQESSINIESTTINIVLQLQLMS